MPLFISTRIRATPSPKSDFLGLLFYRYKGDTSMTRADKVTAIRLFLAPIFFIVYFLPTWSLPPSIAKALFSFGTAWTVPVLWLLFIVSELSDLIDGKVARRFGEVGDFGKLFDPFADVLVRITYFLCFILDGILPVLIFLPILYREFSIQFIRVLMMAKGIAMGARMGGKVKSVTYMVAGVLALVAASIPRLNLGFQLFVFFKTGAAIVFCISMVFALLSLFDYIQFYRKS